MKINRYGTVIIAPGPILVEGWLVEREPTDPPESEATNEQMLLEVVIPWAQRKLNDAILQNLKRISQEKKAQNPTTTTGTN